MGAEFLICLQISIITTILSQDGLFYLVKDLTGASNFNTGKIVEILCFLLIPILTFIYFFIITYIKSIKHEENKYIESNIKR